MPSKPNPAPENPPASSRIFASLAGLFFFLIIIKFGSPIILDRFFETPKNWTDAINFPWPPHWAACLFVPLAIAGLLAIEWNRLNFHWVLTLPIIWLGWEFISASQSVSPALTKLTLTHFVVCVGLFYLGFFARKGMANPWPVWAGMGLALCWAMRAGIQQHFGGLEATRKMLLYSPNLSDLNPKILADPEYLRRIAGNRIFGTFGGYPNSLAGALLLLLPLTLVFLWQLTPKVGTSIRLLFVLVLGACGLGCLFWSGSKAGWLVAMTVGLAALTHSKLPSKWKQWLIFLILAVGITAFACKYAGYFHKERNSAGARFAYWRAALIVTHRHPWLGTGPGTFQIPYEKIKRPADEMARLCHNDFLEQGTDSGIFGFISYTGMILTFLLLLYRYSIRKTNQIGSISLSG